MSEPQRLTAEHRSRTGTGGARAVRRAGKIPGIVYGGGQEPHAICLDPIEVTKAYHRGNFQSSLLTLDLDGTAIEVIPREVQTHPVKDNILHVDFMRVDKHTRVTVLVPVHFINEENAPGLRRGGVLNVVRHEVELRCPATSIPSVLEGDLGGLDIGDSIKISAISLPQGAKPTITDRDFTIATIAAPSGMEVEEAAAEEEGEEEAAEAAEESPESEETSA